MLFPETPTLNQVQEADTSVRLSLYNSDTSLLSKATKAMEKDHIASAYACNADTENVRPTLNELFFVLLRFLVYAK